MTDNTQDSPYLIAMNCYHAGSMSQGGKTIHEGTVQEFTERIEAYVTTRLKEAERLARIDELSHIGMDDDEIIVCYFTQENPDCSKDLSIGDRIAELEAITTTTNGKGGRAMTNNTQELNEITIDLWVKYGRPGTMDEFVLEAKQAFTSLIKELVAEAKPDDFLPKGHHPDACLNHVRYTSACCGCQKQRARNHAIDEFEQNLLKALEEV